MLYIRADLIRKPDTLKPTCCTIEKTIEVSAEEYDSLIAAPCKDRSFITENKEHMWMDNEGNHCLLVLGENREDGVLIEAEGYDWVRYGALIPHARDIIAAQNMSPALKELNQKLTAFADSAAEECLKMLEGGERASLTLIDHARGFGIDMEGNGMLWDTVTEMIGERLSEHNFDMEIDNGDLILTPREPEMQMGM